MTNFFWHIVWCFTPAKSTVVDPVTPEMSVTEERPSVYISKVGHVVLGLLYSLLMFGYCGLLIFNWIERESTTVYSLEPATTYGPMQMRLFVYCTNAPHCGDITIRQNYSEAASIATSAMIDDESKQHCRTQEPIVIPAAHTKQSSNGGTSGFKVPLCFTGNPVFNTHQTPILIPGIIVEFSKINPGTNTYYGQPDPKYFAQGVVEVLDITLPGAGTNDDDDNVMSVATAKEKYGRVPRVVNMDTFQVKSLIMGQNVEVTHGAVTNRTAYPVGIQYDGKHPKWTGTFILAQSELSEVKTTSKAPWISILGVLGSCAMAAWVVFVMMIIIIPVWPLLFPGPAQVVINEHKKKKSL